MDVLTGTFLLGGPLPLPWLLATPLGWLATPGGILLAVYLGVARLPWPTCCWLTA
jgi:hypothetical protein